MRSKIISFLIIVIMTLSACGLIEIADPFAGRQEAPKAITAYSFPAATGNINESAKTISVTVPSGTDVTALVAMFTTTGASVKVGSTVQVSGTTANDFTNPVVYTVTATDSSTVNYTVTVIIALATFKVTYNGNGSTSGNVPIDNNNYMPGQTITVLGNTGNLVKTGYSFAGWNTTANGSGISYSQGQTFAMGTANITLYARYTTNPTYTVTYDGNGSTSGSVPIDSMNYEQGATVFVQGNINNLVKTGNSFVGWNTAGNGSGTSRIPGTTFTMGTSNVILYAQWTTNPTYTLTYDGNGSTSGSVPIDSTHYEQGVTITVSGNTGNLVKTGYTFVNWNTASNGSGTSYSAGNTFSMGTANVTLYAQWTVNNYTITFNKNDAAATGTMANQTIAYGSSANLTACGFTKTGWTFAGWATTPAGAVVYADGASYTMGTANVTLYAKWTANNYTITFDKNDAAATGTMSNQTISCGSTANLTACGFTKTGWAFTGWATTPTGAVVYADGASYTMGTANVTLCAQWTVTTGWAQEAYIKAVNNDSLDHLGWGVAISGDTIVASAPWEDSNQTTITNGTTASSDNSRTNNPGAVYVYKRSGTTWAQEAYIKAVNNDGLNTTEGFGDSVAISGDTIAVGADQEDSSQTTITNGTTASADNSLDDSGAVYVYTRSGNTWTQQAYIKAANCGYTDFFGYRLAISGDTIVVGTPYEASNQTTITNGTTASADNSITDSGAVYVYKRTGSTWAQEAYIKACNNRTTYEFGEYVAVSGDTIAVASLAESSSQATITNGTSAPTDTLSTTSGAVYVYKRTGTNWAQEAYIKAVNNGSGDNFGRGVAISGDTIVAGAPCEDSSQTTITNGTTASADNSSADSGAVYVYKRSGSTWAQEAYIKAANNGINDMFGYYTAIDSDTLVVGAAEEDSNQTTITNGTTASSDNSSDQSGAVYVYKRTGSTWVQEAYIKAANNGSHDMFGFHVAVNGETIVVGAHLEDSIQTTITNGTTAAADNTSADSGAVYAYKRTNP